MKWELNFEGNTYTVNGCSEICEINGETLITDLGVDQEGNKVQIYWAAYPEWLENENRASDDFSDACDWDNPVRVVTL